MTDTVIRFDVWAEDGEINYCESPTGEWVKHADLLSTPTQAEAKEAGKVARSSLYQLAKALEPFAREASSYDALTEPRYLGDTNFEIRYSDDDKATVTVGDLRRASSALSELKSDTGLLEIAEILDAGIMLASMQRDADDTSDDEEEQQILQDMEELRVRMKNAASFLRALLTEGEADHG